MLVIHHRCNRNVLLTKPWIHAFLSSHLYKHKILKVFDTVDVMKVIFLFAFNKKNNREKRMREADCCITGEIVKPEAIKLKYEMGRKKEDEHENAGW